MAKGIPGLPGASAEKTEEFSLGLGGNANEDFSFDFTGDELGSNLIAEGPCYAKVIDFEQGVSKAGKPQFVWQFVCIAGSDKGKEIKTWTSLAPNARWNAIETLEACGVSANGTLAKFKKSDVVGKPVILTVRHEEFNGRDTHKVDRVFPPDEACLEAFNNSGNAPKL